MNGRKTSVFLFIYGLKLTPLEIKATNRILLRLIIIEIGRLAKKTQLHGISNGVDNDLTIEY